MTEQLSDDVLFPIGAEALAQLHRRVVRDAQRAGLVDVAYRTIDGPVGTLLLAATESGLVRVAFEREHFDRVLQTIAEKVSARILHSPGRLDDAARQLDEYFAGGRQSFDLPLDFALSSGFRQLVQRRLPTIGYGRTATYKQIAQAVGNPAAVRAVGTACATNPLPLVVPCHRVMRSDGTVGGYAGGVAAKRLLLDLERTA